MGGRLLDALVLGIPASILLAVAGMPAPTIALGGTDAWVPSAVTSAVWFAYHVGLEATIGTTLGKRLMRVRVVDVAGGAPGLGSAVLRNAWLLAGLLPIVGGVLWLAAIVVITAALTRADGRTAPHDRLAGTRVVRADDERR